MVKINLYGQHKEHQRTTRKDPSIRDPPLDITRTFEAIQQFQRCFGFLMIIIIAKNFFV